MDIYIDEEVREQVKLLLARTGDTMGEAIGIRFTSFAKDEVRAVMPVDGRTVQPFGLLHGGASVALAETLASVGAWLQVDPETQSAVGVEINANHLRPARSGQQVEGTARPLHIGRQTQVWEIKIRDGEDRLVCVARCTLAVVKRREE
ncbi:MAG: hotdog fold thioesterase [Balneolaceae bacterium]|nr:hotdog fold thioesterase [Balneolaceae bacterium]